MRVTKIAHERLHLALASDVESRRGLVEEEQHRRGQERPRDRDLLLHAARKLLERLAHALRLDAEPSQDRRDLRSRRLWRKTVQPPGVHEVLHRRQLLEEGGLNGHAVDEPLHGELVARHVEAEDRDLAVIGLQQRREHADQRRLARSVRSEQAVDLAAPHHKRYVVDRAHGRAAARDRPSAAEYLAHRASLQRGHTCLDLHFGGPIGFANLDGHFSSPAHKQKTAGSGPRSEGLARVGGF